MLACNAFRNRADAILIAQRDQENSAFADYPGRNAKRFFQRQSNFAQLDTLDVDHAAKLCPALAEVSSAHQSLWMIFRQTLLGLLCMVGLASPDLLRAQQPAVPAQRALGVRVGAWNVRVPELFDPEASVYGEIFLHHSLGSDLALENSIAGWRVITTEDLPFPATNTVEVKTYIVPLILALKLYLFDSAEAQLSPYVSGGAGLVFGIEKEGSAAVGGGGTSVVTGFGMRGTTGVQACAVPQLCLTGSARYQWLHFGETVGSISTYRGVGFEGGITYRFRF